MFKKVIAGLLLVSSVSFAANQAADDYKTATELYSQRAEKDRDGNFPKVLKALEILKNAAATADTDELKYDIAVLTSRCNYWIGQQNSEKNVKLERFQAAMDAANVAKKISDDYAEGYYFYGVALSRWAETNGVMASLGKKDELIKSMKDTQARVTRAEKGGETIDGNGPDRILGRIYFKLPGFAGGSRSESLKHLDVAYKAEPYFFLNGIFYAETLATGGSDAEKTKGCDILKLISSKKADDGYPDRLPENAEDIADAQALANKLCK